jgi:hypothetical protein
LVFQSFSSCETLKGLTTVLRLCHAFFSRPLDAGTPSGFSFFNVYKILLGPDFETTRFPTDPLVDQEILDQMEPVYYQQDFDPSKHELNVRVTNEYLHN